MKTEEGVFITEPQSETNFKPVYCRKKGCCSIRTPVSEDADLSTQMLSLLDKQYWVNQCRALKCHFPNLKERLTWSRDSNKTGGQLIIFSCLICKERAAVYTNEHVALHF